ncbi:hypothetical protein IMZ48_12290 [Candidatus Bathyarchaeota archaeon]|nr:hypothetical protein [Candidatus Bathyarchaeota archaeon]
MLPAIFASAESKVSIAFEKETKTGLGFEDLVIRPSSALLTSRLYDNHLWNIDLDSETGSELVEVPGVNSIIGIARLADDVYVFAAGNMTSDNRVSGAWGLWKVDLTGSGDQEPVPELITLSPSATRLAGVAVWDGSRVLMSDFYGNKVHVLDIWTGEWLVPLEHPEIKQPFGIKVHDSSIYISTSEGTIYRLLVDGVAHVLGTPEIMASDYSLTSYFDIVDDGTIYAVSYDTGKVVEITQEKKITVIAGDGDNYKITQMCRSVAAVGRTDGKHRTLYATKSGRKIVSIEYYKYILLTARVSCL